MKLACHGDLWKKEISDNEAMNKMLQQVHLFGYEKNMLFIGTDFNSLPGLRWHAEGEHTMIAVHVSEFLRVANGAASEHIKTVEALFEAVKAIGPDRLAALSAAGVQVLTAHVPAHSLLFLPGGYVYVQRGCEQQHVFGLRTSVCHASGSAASGLEALASLVEDAGKEQFLEQWRNLFAMAP